MQNPLRCTVFKGQWCGYYNIRSDGRQMTVMTADQKIDPKYHDSNIQSYILAEETRKRDVTNVTAI